MKTDRQKLLYIFTLILLFMVHGLLLYFINRKMPYLIDSDMSSEMILSNILSKKNSIITDSWYYSTELRVFNTHLVYSLFFKLTDNWHTVRLLSTAVLHVILTLSTMYLCRKTGCKKYAPLVACTMLLALSREQFYIVLMGCYYIPHIAISLLTIALCIAFSKSKGKKQILIIASSALLALMSGIGGLRQIVITYFPLLICTLILETVSFIKNNFKPFKNPSGFKYLLISVINILFSGAGYLINNSILAKKYNFQQHGNINFTKINSDSIFELLSDILHTLGFMTGQINGLSVISNGICALIVILLVYSVIHGIRDNVKPEYKLLTVFFLCNLTVFFMLYAFTDMVYTVRYNLPVIIFSFPLIASGLRETSFEKTPKYIKPAIGIFCVAIIFIRGFCTMVEIRRSNRIGELETVAEFLSDSEYDNGYASFWNSNVITELTNGKEDMYTWFCSDPDGQNFNVTGSVNDMFRWLQKTEHVSVPPSGKVFTLYSHNEIEYCNWKSYLRDSDIIFQNGTFIIYGYENYESMIEILHQDSIQTAQ